MASANEIVLQIDSTKRSPRNTEGSFVTLKSGRILYAFWHFTGGWGDDSEGCVGLRHSDDGGRTWSPRTRILVPNEADQTTVMSTLLRLADGRIALVYKRKHGFHDCRPYIRFSDDEAKTWSDPKLIIDPVGYFVVNNDRVIQLSSGRLVVPAAYHRMRGADGESWGSWDSRAIAMWWLSDDNGETWREAKTWWAMPRASGSGLQEPGVIELKNGRLFCYCRTDQGCQYGMYSKDGGETWSAPKPTQFKSPCSPLSIKRIPKTGDLLAVWNDHSGTFPYPDAGWMFDRTPLVAAISTDEGKTWPQRRLLEGSFERGFCYTAIHFADDHCLLAYMAGKFGQSGRNPYGPHSSMRMRRIKTGWFYA